MDKSVQCIDVMKEDGSRSAGCDVVDVEFNNLSIEIYKLIINLKEKSFDIVNEYGLNSLTNSPKKLINKKKKNGKLYQADTDDVDITSIIINCKKRNESLLRNELNESQK